MIEDVQNINWNVIAFAEAKEKLGNILPMEDEGFKLFYLVMKNQDQMVSDS